MSANNWARCPRCTVRGEQRLAGLHAELEKLYGTAPVREFDKARADLTVEIEKFAKRVANFREDYEISGAESGTVKVTYGGQCQDCGLSLSFDEEHEIPDWKTL